VIVLKANASILNAQKPHFVILEITFHVPIMPHQEVEFNFQLCNKNKSLLCIHFSEINMPLLRFLQTLYLALLLLH